MPGMCNSLHIMNRFATLFGRALLKPPGRPRLYPPPAQPLCLQVIENQSERKSLRRVYPSVRLAAELQLWRRSNYKGILPSTPLRNVNTTESGGFVRYTSFP